MSSRALAKRQSCPTSATIVTAAPSRCRAVHLFLRNPADEAGPDESVNGPWHPANDSRNAGIGERLAVPFAIIPDRIVFRGQHVAGGRREKSAARKGTA